MKDTTPTLRGIEPEITTVWRGNGRSESTIRIYRRWGYRFERHCRDQRFDWIAELTRRKVEAFAGSYASSKELSADPICAAARSALRAWSFALDVLGLAVPEWEPPRQRPEPAAILVDFGHYRLRHHGVAVSTVMTDQGYLEPFLDRLCPTADLSSLDLTGIDEYLIDLSKRYKPKTVARVATALRCFLRFLHATGRVSRDLAASVKAPVVRAGDQPPRSIPWSEVCSILAAIPRTEPTGCRDYALLLMMATYGLGAGEVLSLCLEDVDWCHGIVHVRRPKTGIGIDLPLLPAIGVALSEYLEKSRPRHTAAREIFVSRRIPHGPLQASAICHAVQTHARNTDVRPRFLGSHVLRHSHASFQIDQGAPPHVVSDILGHRNPSSISAYVRVAFGRLRDLALPVPR